MRNKDKNICGNTNGRHVWEICISNLIVGATLLRTFYICNSCNKYSYRDSSFVGYTLNDE